MATLDFLKDQRDEILAIAAKHGASNVRIFGSVARAEESSTSDIDLLVDMSDERSLYDLVGLQLDLETVLGHRADVITPESLSPFMRDRILAEAVPL